MLRLALLAALAAFAHGLTVPSVRTTPVASPGWAPVKLDAKAWVGPAAATFAAVTSPEAGASSAPVMVTATFVVAAAPASSAISTANVIVTLSPARSCGWETWFSCTYGEDLQKLRCPVQPQRTTSLAKLIADTETAIGKLREDLAAREDVASKAKGALHLGKYHARRAVQLRHDTQTLEQLQRLAALGAAGKTSTNDGPACVIS